MNKRTYCAALIAASLSALATTHVVAAALQPTAEDMLALEAAAPGAGDGAQGACGPIGLVRHGGSVSAALAERFKSLDAGMVQKNYGLVMGLARKYAGQFSYCYTKYPQSGGIADLPIYAAGVGHFLTVVALAGRNGRLETPQSTEARTLARVLLNAGRGVSAVVVQDLDILDTLDPDSATTSTSAPEEATTFTVTAANAAWRGNQLAFDRQYLGKRVRLIGYLRRVTAGEDLAIVTVAPDRGAPTGNSDIDCLVTDMKALDMVAVFTAGEAITAVGRYEKNPADFELKLRSCRVERRADPGAKPKPRK